MADIEKALPRRKYQYIGYSRTSKVYYIFRPTKKGKDWYMRHKEFELPSYFGRTLKELRDKLDSI